MSEESKKSNGKPTVELSGKTCSLCDKSSHTVVLKYTQEDFKAVVCPEHMFSLLRKWEKEKATEAPQPKENNGAPVATSR